MGKAAKKTVLVAGDVCLDVVGIPIPGVSPGARQTDNWRLKGEMRTTHIPGGAFQLAEFIRAADASLDVRGPTPCLPKGLSCGRKVDKPMTQEEFEAVAPRLTRDEIVHSLLQLDLYKETADSKKPDTVRVNKTRGFSGPKEAAPSMKLLPPAGPGGKAAVVVLDDTGNQFRHSPEQWPKQVASTAGATAPLVVYKLHRPLPGTGKPNRLWDAVMGNHADRCVVIVSVDDLRDCDAPISRGLSWERTALDVVWHLLHSEALSQLRGCPHLIVRLGLDGALYWRHTPPKKDGETEHRAWLVYDPTGIEGTGAGACQGRMVGYASAFTAALTRHLAADLPGCLKPRATLHDPEGRPSEVIEDAIVAGIAASRRLLVLGFGKNVSAPAFPKDKLFDEGEDIFGSQPVPIIPGAAVADRGHWSLLESIFLGQDDLLQRAVDLQARAAKATEADDKRADALFRQVPQAVFAKTLRAIDRREVENYRALYSLLRDYLLMPPPPKPPQRPLSVAVFGPPGAGKSFGVKMVAKALGEIGGATPIEPITFNLSQYQKPDDLADAFHLVRDMVLAGRLPLVFFDEFDAVLNGEPLGWLRYFLAPMQDGEFTDHGTPHPIGKAIFVFAGGTCASYAEFARPGAIQDPEDPAAVQYKKVKGPDFLSRLRATLDIPGLDLETDFDPFGPAEALPSQPAILLRRANIFAFQVKEKFPHLRDASGALKISKPVLRALLNIPKFVHGNRSFEAILDMSHVQGAERFTPALLPACGHTALHANDAHLCQLLTTDYPFPPVERKKIARRIHEFYVEQRKADPTHKPDDPALRPWGKQGKDDIGLANRRSSLAQADHIAYKLRSIGLWFRKKVDGVPADVRAIDRLEAMVETLAIAEHNRWVVEKRKDGWFPAADTERESKNSFYRLHNALFPWGKLPADLKELDRAPVRNIPKFLDEAGYEIILACQSERLPSGADAE